MKKLSLIALLSVSSFMDLGSMAVRPLLAEAPATSSHATPKPQFLHWSQFPVHVYFGQLTAAQKAEAQLTLAGFDEWVGASHGKIRYAVTQSPGDAEITVKYEPVAYLSSETKMVGETTVLFSGLTLKKASIRLAEGMSDPGAFQSAAAHEFGHALGIQSHSDDPDDLMYPTETSHFSALGDPLPSSLHTVTGHDLNLLKLCYPHLFSGSN